MFCSHFLFEETKNTPGNTPHPTQPQTKHQTQHIILLCYTWVRKISIHTIKTYFQPALTLKIGCDLYHQVLPTKNELVQQQQLYYELFSHSNSSDDESYNGRVIEHSTRPTISINLMIRNHQDNHGIHNLPNERIVSTIHLITDDDNDVLCACKYISY